jgi:hypothetical protein
VPTPPPPGGCFWGGWGGGGGRPPPPPPPPPTPHTEPTGSAQTSRRPYPPPIGTETVVTLAFSSLFADAARAHPGVANTRPTDPVTPGRGNLDHVRPVSSLNRAAILTHPESELDEYIRCRRSPERLPQHGKRNQRSHCCSGATAHRFFPSISVSKSPSSTKASSPEFNATAHRCGCAQSRPNAGPETS